MKPEIRNLQDITYSREVYEAKPKPIIAIFIYIVLVILLVTILWMYFGEIDMVVKSNGYVRPNDKVSTVENMISGKVDKVNLENGQKVKMGDILYTINHENLLLDKKLLKEKIANLNKDITLLKKYKDAIKTNKNTFNQETEEEYYSRYKKFSLDYKLLKNEYKYKTGTLRIQEKELNEQISEIRNELKFLKDLKESIVEQKNLVAGNTEYAIKYDLYLEKIAELKTKYEQLKKEYDINLSLNNIAVTNHELEQSKINADNAKKSIEVYRKSYIEKLINLIKNNETKLRSLQQSYNKILVEKQKELTIMDGDKLLIISLENYREKEFLNTINSIKQQSKQLQQYKNQLMKVEEDISKCIVTAQKSGTINLVKDIVKGDSVFSGTKILTIIPDNNTKYKIQIYVSNRDIAKIRIGDKVKYHFSALPYDEYGEMPGKIVKISSDVTVNEKSGQSYYIVEATLDSNTAYDYKGNQKEVLVGMACEAQIITGQKKILHYVLERINLID